jgi:hypothetical protein
VIGGIGDTLALPSDWKAPGVVFPDVAE